MIITVLTQKYNCGCNRGISKEETPDLLKKLNKSIQWDKVTWPEKEKDVPDTDYLGNPPQLKPGDTFLWDGNVFAINDENSIVLIVSETGPLSVKRFVNYLDCDYKYKLSTEGTNINDLDMEVVPWEEPGDDLEEFRVKYTNYICIKNRLNAPEVLKKIRIKINNLSLPVILPTVIYIEGQKILYNPEEIDPNILEDVLVLVFYYIIETQNKEKKGN